MKRFNFKEKRGFLFSSLGLIAVFCLFQNCGTHNYNASQFVKLASPLTGNSAEVSGPILELSARAESFSAVVDGNFLIFGGLGASGPLNDLYSFNPTTQVMTDLSVPLSGTPPSPRYEGTAVSMNGKFYVFGGRTPSDDTLNDFYSYDPVAQAWTDLTPISTGPAPSTRCAYAAVAVSNVMYLVGGMGITGSSSTEMNDIYSYDPVAKLWTNLTSVSTGTPPSARAWGVAAVAPSGLIYLYGGNAGGSLQSDLHTYDPIGKAWTTLSYSNPLAVPSLRSDPEGVIISNQLYIFGGRSLAGGLSLNDFYSLDLGTLTWSTITTASGSVPAIQDSGNAFVSSGNFYILNGMQVYNGGIPSSPMEFNYLATFNYYDPSSNSWTNLY